MEKKEESGLEEQDVKFENFWKKIMAGKEIEKEEKRLEELAIDTVLTISASEHAESVDKNLSDYDFKGVEAFDDRVYCYQIGCRRLALSARGWLAKIGEELNAEIVVAVEPAVQLGDTLYLIGTALIPKK